MIYCITDAPFCQEDAGKIRVFSQNLFIFLRRRCIMEKRRTRKENAVHYATIKNCDIANGEGVRISLFVSGCTHRCKGCFNEIAWDFSYGEPFTEATAEHIFTLLAPDYIAGLSLLGGEPFEPGNQRALLPFLCEFRRRFPHKTVWCYTGYLYEELTDGSRARCEATDEMLSYIDILVDGPFVEEKKSLQLRFRGSSNQRVLDLHKTRASGTPVIWEKLGEKDGKVIR